MITKILDNLSINRVNHWLETGEYPYGVHSLTWDLLTYCDYCKKDNK